MSSNLDFLGYPSTSLRQTSSSSSREVGFGFGQGSNSSMNANSYSPSFCSHSFAGNSTSSAPLSPFGGAVHHSATQSSFSAQATPSLHSHPFSAQTQTNQVTGFSSTQSNSNSPFPLLHSNLFSAQTHNTGVTPFSPFSSRSNANSPFPSLHSNPFSPQTQGSGVTKFSNANSLFPSPNPNATSTFSPLHPIPFSTQTQSNNVTGFAPFSSHSNTNSPFPTFCSNPFSGQTQSNSVTGFAPFSSNSNTNSPFPSVCSNPFSGLTQSSGVTGFAPFSSNSNTNSPFPSFYSNPFSSQTQSSGVTGFAPFSSQSNANSYLSNYSNPFTSQTQSFNSTLSATIPISAPVLLPSSGSSVAPYTSTKEPEGNFHSISSMPDYRSKSHEELRFEDYSQCKKDGQSATMQTGNGKQLYSFCPSLFPSVKPTYTNLFPAILSPPTNSHTTFPGFISPANTQSMPSNPTGLFTPSTSATTQENTFAPKCSSSAFDFPNSPNIAPSLSPFVSNSSLSQFTAPGSNLCSNCNRVKTQSFQPALDGPSTNLSPNQLKPSSVQQTVQELGKDVGSTPQFQSSVEPDAVQVSSIHPGSVISVQYGISSLSVPDKAAPTRRRSLLIVRHSSLNRTKMLPPRYNPDSNASRVPFFMAGEEKATEGAVKTTSIIFPRENPRSWIRPPTKESPQSYNSNTLPEMEHTSVNVYDNGNIVVELSAPASASYLHPDTSILDGNVTQAHLAKEKQTDTCEAGSDVDDIMPKLTNDDYYTEPTIQELAAKEKEETGFCGGVKDFIVGRRGYGAIKFTGETDVRGLELDALIQFNYHEVIVYMDDSKKPEVGKGLTKPAEVTLLNLKCINKKTGEEYKDGHLVDKYKNLLIRKSAEQGAEFVSYDPLKGEWKFKVNHF